MTNYILRRLLLILPVMLVVGSVTFVLIHVTPGDPAAVMLGPEATPGEIEELQDRLNLNEPLIIQYPTWLAGLAQGDFGDSIFLDRPVTQALWERLLPTMQLAFYALAFAILLGIPAGIIAAVRQNSLLDRAVMALAISGAAIPNFFLGIVLILIFAVTLRWLPSGGYVPFTEDPVGHIEAMFMPAITLGFSAAALPARLIRTTMLDVLREDYITAAVARGVRANAIAVRHALRNALLPAVTVLGHSLGDLMGGAVVVETVYGIPGMGLLIVNSIGRRDFPVVQGAVMLIAFFYILANLLVDILYLYIDPRVRYGGR